MTDDAFQAELRKFAQAALAEMFRQHVLQVVAYVRSHPLTGELFQLQAPSGEDAIHVYNAIVSGVRLALQRRDEEPEAAPAVGQRSENPI